MGKRLINTRSVVQDILTKTYYSYQLYNGNIMNKNKYPTIKRNSIRFRSNNKSFGKINNGVKSFFHSPLNGNNSIEPLSVTNYSRDIEEDLNKTVIL